MSRVVSAVVGTFVGGFCNALGCAAALTVSAYLYLDTNSGFLGSPRDWAPAMGLFGLIAGALAGIVIGVLVGALRTRKFISGAIGVGVNFASIMILLRGDMRLALVGSLCLVSGAIAGIAVAAWLENDTHF